MSYGVGHRCSSDSELLWLQLWPAAGAPIQPLAWELPCALKKKKKKKKKEKKRKKERKRNRTSRMLSKLSNVSDKAKFLTQPNSKIPISSHVFKCLPPK